MSAILRFALNVKSSSIIAMFLGKVFEYRMLQKQTFKNCPQKKKDKMHKHRTQQIQLKRHR